jgi:hypothetical protein
MAKRARSPQKTRQALQKLRDIIVTELVKTLLSLLGALALAYLVHVFRLKP